MTVTIVGDSAYSESQIDAHGLRISRGTGAPSIEAAVHRREDQTAMASSRMRSLHLADQIAESRQGHQLPWGEKIAPFGHAVVADAESQRRSFDISNSGFHSGLPERDWVVLGGRRKINPSSCALRDDRHQPVSQSPCSFASDMM